MILYMRYRTIYVPSEEKGKAGGGIVVGESQLKVTRGYGKIAFEFVLRFGNCWVVSSLCCFDDKMPSGNSFGSQTTKHS